MAPLALFLTFVLTVVLLWRDSKRRPTVSKALWIPTLLVLVFASRTPSLWFLTPTYYSSGLSNEASGSLMDQVFYFSVILGSWFIATRRGVKWSKLFTANYSLMLFYCYFVLSSVWSAYPSESFVRIIKDFGLTVIVICAILTEKDPLEALRAVYTRCACLLFPLSVCVIKYRFGDFGRTYARGGEALYVGVTTQKNSLGELAMVLGLFLVWDFLETPTVKKQSWTQRRWDVLLLLLMGAYLLNISQSKTCLVCFVIGVAYMFVSSKMFGRLSFIVAMSLPFIVFSTQEFSSVFAPLLNALGRDMTFTGRTGIWAHITMTTVNPWIGAGFWNFWGGPGGQAITIAMKTPIPNAHNGYLDIYIDGGFVGLVILFFLLANAGRRLVKRLPINLFQRVRFSFLIVAIVGNLTESHFARPSLIWFTTVLAILEFPALKPREEFVLEPLVRPRSTGVVEVYAESAQRTRQTLQRG